MGHHHTARAGGGQAKKENREQWQRGTPCQAGRASLLWGAPLSGLPAKEGWPSTLVVMPLVPTRLISPLHPDAECSPGPACGLLGL